MSASLIWIAWKAEIGLPNCRRFLAYCKRPRQKLPAQARLPARHCRSGPSFNRGQELFETAARRAEQVLVRNKNTPRTARRRCPKLECPFCFPVFKTEKPGLAGVTRKQSIPREPSAGSVTAVTTIKPAREPLVQNTLGAVKQVPTIDFSRRGPDGGSIRTCVRLGMADRPRSVGRNKDREGSGVSALRCHRASTKPIPKVTWTA